VVFKHNPLSFHDKAELAAEGAVAAHAQGKFWEYHDKLFDNMQALDRADLDTYASDIGLDMTRFKEALDKHTGLTTIRLDQEGAAEVQAKGTPAFYINGKKLDGNTVDKFKELIDTELKAAEKLVKAGTAPSAVYDKTVEKGKLFKALEAKVNSFTHKGSPIIGKAPARIQIHEFSEFQ